ncbi:hypothetical protein C9374_011295 [Naegleria lovaniensis]|uniref:CN hydrolase domain-containing protein n=1 Tax=Naegleria lovaniensis TaxID=51637 RepID=A0AA88GX36_NAELO|nr:uncharacterized protein C9374_011295 [Naegleria lovaniensis]KAG2392570.1 hypothetical protein C9374_011295 [Naegleria lovaniensis]
MTVRDLRKHTTLTPMLAHAICKSMYLACVMAVVISIFSNQIDAAKPKSTGQASSYQVSKLYSSNQHSKLTYHAAVVDFAPVSFPFQFPQLNSETARKILKSNLDEFEKIIMDIMNHSTTLDRPDIIVFPEYALFGPGLTEREKLRLFFEPIPNHLPVTNICGSSQYDQYYILKRISCLSAKFGAYIVFNMGDVQKCNLKTNKNCPADGMFLFNTNVVFDRNGSLISKYHKTHLYFENGIDPGDGTPVYFETDFGVKFGLLICFDIIFEEPLNSLLNDIKVDAIAFTSWWVNFPPYWNALPFQQALSYTYGIHLIAASSGTSYTSSGSGIHMKGKSMGVYNPSFKGRSQTVSSQTSSAATYSVTTMNDQLVKTKRVVPMQDMRMLSDRSNPQHQLTSFTFADPNHSNFSTIIPFIPVKGKSYDFPEIVAGSTSCNFKFTVSPFSNITENDSNNYFAMVVTDGKVFKPKFEQASCSVMKCGSYLNCFIFLEWKLLVKDSEVVLSDLTIEMQAMENEWREDVFPMLLGDQGNLFIGDLHSSSFFKTNAALNMQTNKTPAYVSVKNVKNKFLGGTLLSLKRPKK